MAQSTRLPPAGRKLVAARAGGPTRNAAPDKGRCSIGRYTAREAPEALW
jgi:hypothetical protein